MPLISHEIPLDLIDRHQDFVSDYMFALLHKAKEDKEYLNKVCDYRDAGGVVYLDNSCFELGESMSDELLMEYFEIIRPDIVILPDVLGDMRKTIQRSFAFMRKYRYMKSYAMLVAQGSTPDEMIECYQIFANMNVAMLGIPFVYSWAPKIPQVQALERIKLLQRMVDEDIIDPTIKHHLLGTWAAEEFAHYRDYEWIYSIDTSNPVMAALDGTGYTPKGIIAKPKSTFDSSYHLKENEIDMELLYYNVQAFRRIVNGEE